MKKLSLLLVAFLCATAIMAYDFSEVDRNGNTIYYTILGDTEFGTDSLAVTYASLYPNDYAGDIVIPDYVMYLGSIYHVTVIGQRAFYGAKDLRSVTMPETVTRFEAGAFAYSGIRTLNWPSGLKTIGEGAFQECTSLLHVEIPEQVTRVEGSAFYGCRLVQSVSCYAQTPPDIIQGTFITHIDTFNLPDPEFVYNNVPVLYVHKACAQAYRSSLWMENFDAIIGVNFGESEVEDITPASVVIKWLTDEEVAQYTIKIFKDLQPIVQYTVDAEGHMTGSQRFAPSVYHLPMDSTTSSTDYFVLTVNDLEAGTDYTYKVEGSNTSSAPVYHEEGAFRTEEWPEGIETPALKEGEKGRLFLRNGQVFILRDDKIYTLQGQEVR